MLERIDYFRSGTEKEQEMATEQWRNEEAKMKNRERRLQNETTRSYHKVFKVRSQLPELQPIHYGKDTYVGPLRYFLLPKSTFQNSPCTNSFFDMKHQWGTCFAGGE